MSWKNLPVEVLGEVFPDIQPAYGLEWNTSHSWQMYMLDDAAGNTQFAFCLKDDNRVRSHGPHILRPIQIKKLLDSGAEIFEL